MKLLVFLAAISLTACQSMPYQPYAREVKRVPGTGGEIALKIDHRDEDRTKAQTIMAANCGTAEVKIVEEGEVVVGQTTNTNAQETHNGATAGTKVGSLWGMPIMSGGHSATNDTNATATTTNLKEWNIKYSCEKAQATHKHARAAASTTTVQ